MDTANIHGDRFIGTEVRNLRGRLVSNSGSVRHRGIHIRELSIPGGRFTGPRQGRSGLFYQRHIRGPASPRTIGFQPRNRPTSGRHFRELSISGDLFTGPRQGHSGLFIKGTDEVWHLRGRLVSNSGSVRHRTLYMDAPMTKDTHVGNRKPSAMSNLIGEMLDLIDYLDLLWDEGENVILTVGDSRECFSGTGNPRGYIIRAY